MSKPTHIFSQNRSIKDCLVLVNHYNEAVELNNKDILLTFRFKKIESPDFILERIYKIYDFKIRLNPDNSVIERLLKAENRLIKKDGFPYCPCKIDHSKDNICPCKDAIQEIREKGVCHCKMYVKNNEKKTLSDEDLMIKELMVVK